MISSFEIEYDIKFLSFRTLIAVSSVFFIEFVAIESFIDLEWKYSKILYIS